MSNIASRLADFAREVDRRLDQFRDDTAADAASASASAAIAVAAAAAAPVTPEAYGAVGDGVTDDYAALKLFCAAISNSNGLNAKLGKNKNYYVGQYATASNGVVSLIIQDATGLTFDGNGATITFKGDFDRNVSTTAGIGTQVQNCTKSKFFNYTLKGNCQSTTVSSGANESFQSYGINVLGCTDCEFDNIEASYFGTDGITVNGRLSGGSFLGSRNILFTNCDLHHNGRLAGSVMTAEYVTWKNCKFTYSGQTGGEIHAPQSGMDIEPDRALKYGTVDLNTNNIVFEDCKFNNNVGGDIYASLASIDGPITFERCDTDATGGSTLSAIIVGVPGVVFRDCKLNLADRRLELPAGSTGLVTHLFDNCEIVGSAATISTIYSNFTTKSTVFHKCRIKCTATSAKTAGVPFINVNNSAFILDDCDIFIPKEWFLNEGSGACKIMDVIMRRSSNNRWSTDMTTAGSYFYTKWNTTTVLDESYTGQIPGTADTIRPAISSSFDTTRRYTNRGLLSSSSSLGVGYDPSVRGTVTQATSKSTGVTLNTLSGSVTMNAAALAAGAKVSFVVTNSSVVATDTIIVSVASGGTANAYRANVTAVAAGSFTITVENITGGSLSEAPVINFAVLRG